MAEGELQDLDLLNPGKLWATAEHQKDVTFHILFPDKDSVTKEKCKEAVDPGLDMIQPMTTIESLLANPAARHRQQPGHEGVVDEGYG